MKKNKKAFLFLFVFCKAFAQCPSPDVSFFSNQFNALESAFLEKKNQYDVAVASINKRIKDHYELLRQDAMPSAANEIQSVQANIPKDLSEKVTKILELSLSLGNERERTLEMFKQYPDFRIPYDSLSIASILGKKSLITGSLEHSDATLFIRNILSGLEIEHYNEKDYDFSEAKKWSEDRARYISLSGAAYSLLYALSIREKEKQEQFSFLEQIEKEATRRWDPAWLERLDPSDEAWKFKNHLSFFKEALEDYEQDLGNIVWSFPNPADPNSRWELEHPSGFKYRFNKPLYSTDALLREMILVESFSEYLQKIKKEQKNRIEMLIAGLSSVQHHSSSKVKSINIFLDELALHTKNRARNIKGEEPA